MGCTYILPEESPSFNSLFLKLPPKQLSTEFGHTQIISPAGFEQMFTDMSADPEAMTGESALAIDARYGLEVDYASVEQLCAEHGLLFRA